MSTLAIDTETELISDTTPLPRLVCLSYAADGMCDLVKHEDARPVLEAISQADEVVLHNAAYDMGVLSKHDPKLVPLIFDLYERGAIRDTYIREALARIERGTLDVEGPMTLEALTLRNLGVQLDKSADGWRLRYGELRDVPLEDWPADARDYATADAASTLGVYRAQKSKPDEVLQTRADFALRLMSAHGVCVDPAAVDAFELDLRERAIEHLEALRAEGLVRKDGTRDTKKTRSMIEEILKEKTPRTDPSSRFPEGQVQYNEDALRSTEHPALVALADYSDLGKLINTYVPVLRDGIEHPIHCSYRVLVATGRTSCARPNLQQLPRAAGARECFVPRPGHVFVTCDWNVAELRALAQVCYTWFGASALRDAFLAKRDPHLMLAAQMRGISFDDALARMKAKDPEIKADRQIAKSANFGLAGGLGADSFVVYARGQGVTIARDRAVVIKETWKRTWYEITPYFQLMSQVTGDFGTRQLEQFGSGRVRGGLMFTQAANTMFQGLVADIAKDALWEVTKRVHTSSTSWLRYFRPSIFLHDEILGEAPEECAHEVATELEEVMTEVMGRWLPDVPALADSHTMRRWQKSAEQVRDKNNRIIPFEDRDL